MSLHVFILQLSVYKAVTAENLEKIKLVIKHQGNSNINSTKTIVENKLYVHLCDIHVLVTALIFTKKPVYN